VYCYGAVRQSALGRQGDQPDGMSRGPPLGQPLVLGSAGLTLARDHPRLLYLYVTSLGVVGERWECRLLEMLPKD